MEGLLSTGQPHLVYIVSPVSSYFVLDCGVLDLAIIDWLTLELSDIFITLDIWCTKYGLNMLCTNHCQLSKYYISFHDFL